jgi:hypothetical protein
MRQGYVSRIVGRDHNYLLKFKFLWNSSLRLVISSFRSPIVAGPDTWNQDRQPPWPVMKPRIAAFAPVASVSPGTRH